MADGDLFLLADGGLFAWIFHFTEQFSFGVYKEKIFSLFNGTQL